MTTYWGSWEYGNNGAGFRVGVSYSISSVNTNSTSVTFTTNWYVETQYNVNDLMDLNYSGSISGSTNFLFNTSSYNVVKFIATKQYTYNYSTWGSSPGTRTFTATLSGVYNGATPTKSITLTIPARPYAVPAAPTNVAWTMNGDGTADLSWTRNATTQAPYSSQQIAFRRWDPTTGSWGSWSYYTISGSATSWHTTGWQPGWLYEGAVKAINTSGASAWAGYIYGADSPLPADGISAALNADGSTIDVTIDPPNNLWDLTGTERGLYIERSVNGGAYSAVASDIADTTTVWTDPTPGAGTNTYRARYYLHSLYGPAAGAYSTYVTSNTVSTIVAPLAPTDLSPSGIAADLTEDLVLTWTHNDGGDGAPQSHYSIRVSSDNGSTWTAYTATNVASSVATHTIPGSSLSNGTTYLWQVQTEGITSAGFGPWSASGTVIGSARPVATITTPGSTVTVLPLTVSWNYSQAQSSAQAAWEARLYDSTGTILLLSYSGSGTTGSKDYDVSGLVQGTDYEAWVRVQSGAGLWSAWDTQAFTYSLLPPATPHLTPEYDSTTGTTVLSITADAVNPGVTVAVDHIYIERKINGGSWVTIGTALTTGIDFLDLLPTVNGDNVYRATAVSASESTSQSSEYTVTPDNPRTPSGKPSDQWVFLNYGPDFTYLLRFRGAPQTRGTGDRDKAVQKYLGRERPQLLLSGQKSETVQVSGTLVFDATGAATGLYDSPPEEWVAAGQDAEVVCLRDYTGRRVFGALSGVDAGDTSPGVGTVAFTVTRTGFSE